ncbi:MAG: hypothetical protein QNK36_20860 [Colwellia sp.]|nr:hypothetical protein [Colwellia sp.]
MKTIIEQGLIGLANAGALNGGNWFVGHFGAEVLSLAFLLLNKRVEKSAEQLVLDRIEEVLETQDQFFETPLPQVNAAKSFGLEDFENAVENCISNLYVDGHHTIYSALALRGFSEYPELARPEIIQGLIALLDACEAAGFDRFYGLDHESFSNKILLEKFAFNSPLDAAEVALAQHREVITDREAAGKFYFFSGSRLHLVTHAQALLELDQLGYANLVKSGLPGFTKHCICIDASAVPQGAEPYKVKQPLDPRQAGFWQRAKNNPHHGKLAYSVLELFNALPQKNQANTLKELSSYWEFYE